ncbi:uncharacterized protein LOC111889280 [Lactuca sativa]|uniref:uncharacterized protein LOC111889280 n=1 Tax=Lactuca sativa TaxID=4236 RepID=UPI000CD86961|nr:uncharacterized protein LOC111889280 [Lactuca sativa]
MVPKEAEGSTMREGKLSKTEPNNELFKAIEEQRWHDLESMIRKDNNVIAEARNSDGNTVLHIMVGIGFNYFVNEMLSLIKDAKLLLEMKNQDGSTALHIAAIVGNKPAAELLLKKNRDLLETKDNKKETPFHKAFENMHLSTIECLLKAANDDGKTKGTPINVDRRKDVNLLVNAISAKKYDLAKELVKNNLEFAVEDDDVLMAISKTFPNGLNFWETFIYPISRIENIEKKNKEPQEAKEVLIMVCKEIQNKKLESRDAYSRYYTKPFLEAARQNAYQVVDEILKRCPEAIRYTDKSGYDIIQLSVIHRSEKIYELIYELGRASNVYKMMEDSSKNNLLHLVGRLAPWHKLKLRTGATLQLQRELQWREEVKKMVSPAYHTKENIFNETPDMVFTNEHKNLVLEAETCMKTIAESCSITAGLITTIVFAAAITVPGGNHQDDGFPLFAGQIPFTIFGISVAISLFASTTALLMFQSILTGRFFEEDFLDSLPTRLIFGLCSLMISTTAMIVAFSTTLFLVFCHKKLWMLAPIGVLAFLPISSFLIVQIQLTVDLLWSTYRQIGYIFEKYNLGNSITYNPNDVSLFFKQ